MAEKPPGTYVEGMLVHRHPRLCAICPEGGRRTRMSGHPAAMVIERQSRQMSEVSRQSDRGRHLPYQIEKHQVKRYITQRKMVQKT